MDRFDAYSEQTVFIKSINDERVYSEGITAVVDITAVVLQR